MKRVEIPQIPLGELVLWTLGVVLVIGLFWIVVRFQNVVLLLLTAVMLSTALHPAVTYLEEKGGVARPYGILLIFAIAGLLLGLLIWFTVPILGEQGAAIRTSLSEGYQLLREGLQNLPNILVQRLLNILPEELPLMTGGNGETTQSSDINLDETVGQAGRLLLGLVYFMTLGILTFFWLLESEYIKRAAYLLIPLPNRNDFQMTVQEIETKVSKYLLGQGFLCLVIGVVAFIAYSIIGLPNALLLAIIAGLLEALPVIGPLLGALPAVIIGLTISPITAFWVLLATLVIQQLEGNLLVPRVMDKTIGVRPLVTLLALLTFGSLFGVLGALIALPLATVIQMLLDRFLLNSDSLDREGFGRDRLSVLRYQTGQLIQDIRSQVRHKESEPSVETDDLEDELETLAIDLESYLALQGQLDK